MTVSDRISGTFFSVQPVEGQSLRERKRIETLIDLAETAIDLFHERGYDNVTVEDIAAGVDVSPRTFFRYYSSKEDVLFPSETETGALLREALLSRPPRESVVVAVQESLMVLAADLTQRRPTMQTRKEIIEQTPALRARELEQTLVWEEILADVIAQRIETTPEQLAPRVIAAACVAGIRVAIDIWLESDEELELLDLTSEVLERLDTGLRGFTDS
jgi:AcrR family transcriptional regulator